MGLFGRNRRPSATRIAEGGGHATLNETVREDEASVMPDSGDRQSRAPTPPSKKANDLELFGADSDESDDEATIDRYANGNLVDSADEKDLLEAESKKVSVLLSKLSPEELFKKYDIDGSGNISASEFLAMLPDLGINISEAKALRIFRKCDTDGGGEIDLNEFKMAMFAVDPVSGNTLGFSPSNLLNPRDAFDLFDTDGTGQIDELEFADVLEYFKMDVSDAKQEAMFKKYDKDKSGYIDYKEFRAMWVRLANVREELIKRGVEIPKYATPWKLQQMLETILEEEETREAQVLAEAQKFLEKQREQQRREELGRKAIIRAQDELAAALDAAGQVYVFGSGKYNQFSGECASFDETAFPGFKAVSELWASRVNPSSQIRSNSIAKPGQHVKSRDNSPPAASDTTTKLNDIKQTKSKMKSAAVENATQRGKFVRRRPENKRWKFQSPPKLNKQSIIQLKKHIHMNMLESDSDDPRSETIQNNVNFEKNVAEFEGNPLNMSTLSKDGKEEGNNQNEELAKLFFEDREFVRSLRFRSTRLMTNTGLLWGKSVVRGAISDSVAFTVTKSGSVFNWGAKNNTWKSSSRQVTHFDSDEDDQSDDDEDENRIASMVHYRVTNSKITPRSAIQKMCTADLFEDAKNPEEEARLEEQLELDRQAQEEDEQYERLKRVVMYYDAWEPPPSNTTRMLFMEQVLIPKLKYEALMNSVQYRGLQFDPMTKMDLMIVLGECFQLEIEVKGEEGHADFKSAEKLITEYSSSKDKKHAKLAQMEKDRMMQSWEELKDLRKNRQIEAENSMKQSAIAAIREADFVFDTRVARQHVQLEDMVPEFTSRGNNIKIELNGFTSRGPSLHSPRGGAAVAQIAAGGSHVILLMHDGSVYTYGIGSNGRLGLQENERGALCYDSDHPQRVEAFQDVSIRHISCAYSYSAAIDSDGLLYAWGSTSCGKLGVGVVEDEYEQYAALPLLVKFPGKRKMRSVSCGSAHTGAVSTSGELFMWGCANGGRLGLGAHVTDTVVVPTLVRDLVNQQVRVWQVSCGTAHSALCTEVISEQKGGSKTLLGGQVYVCGSATALGEYITKWTIIPELNDIGIQEVSCGTSHTAAVSSYGELYTWGRNQNGCTGHDVKRPFIAIPELLKCLHVEPYNLAFQKPCRQVSIYNEQGPELGVNGNIDGKLATCVHTQLEDKPWWEVNLGQPAIIERIRVWNRTDQPLNPSKSRTEYTGRLFPFWILVSEFEFKDVDGKEGLRAAKVQSVAFDLFRTNQRMTEWVLPTTNTVGQYIRIQLQNKNFLHFAEVEVFGVYSAFKYVGRVGSVQCGNEATMIIVPPTAQQSALDDYYLRAVQADADNATILRQFDAYQSSYRKYGRGDGELLREPCRLCRVFRKCEICEFYTKSDAEGFKDDEGQLPLRLTGDRMGLKDLVKLALANDALEAEVKKREEAAKAAEQLKLAQALAEEQKQAKKFYPSILKSFPAPMLSLPFRGKKS